MKNILFISRHTLNDEQMEIVKKVFWEDTNVETKEIIFSTWYELELYKGTYDEFIVVAPIDIVSNILKSWIEPLKFINESRDNEWNKIFKFTWLKRIKKVEIVEEVL